MTGFLVGGMFGLGVIFVAQGVIRLHRPPLAARVLPYVRDLQIAVDARPSGLTTFWGAVVRDRWLTNLSEAVSSTAGVERRLRQLGSTADPKAFRVRQLEWGWWGLGTATAAALFLWFGPGASVLPLLFLCLAGFVSGMVAADMALSAEVRRVERTMVLEFPVLADLMSLAVASGLSPLAALEHVITVASGPLAQRFASVVARTRTGQRLEDALEELARDTGVPSISRFALGLAVAVERGTPLVEVLNAQAADVREASRRELLESAGRREILMLTPVVFIVLPLVVVFSFYPGLVSLEFVSGS